MDQETEMRYAREFMKNTRDLPLEFYLKYANKHIAWSLDGREVRAEADTWEGLYQKMDELGISPGDVVTAYMPDPDVSWL